MNTMHTYIVLLAFFTCMHIFPHPLLTAPRTAYNGILHGIDVTCDGIHYIPTKITSESALQTYGYIALSALAITTGKTAYHDYASMNLFNKKQINDFVCLSIATVCFATLLNLATNSTLKAQ
jgi:hypothetical protein